MKKVRTKPPLFTSFEYPPSRGMKNAMVSGSRLINGESIIKNFNQVNINKKLKIIKTNEPRILALNKI